MSHASIKSTTELADRLRATGYLPDDGLATIGYLALAMQRPLLVEGAPGTGKTALAEALAQTLGIKLIRLQCYEGIDASQAIYEWDFNRQILHLRAAETTGNSRAAPGETGALVGESERSLYDERFLLARPILQALRQSPVVLLIDEIDRADDEFEAFLLEVLSSYQVSIPEYGTVSAATPPLVVLTSNRTRELHDALKRRCLYHWIDHPGFDREVEIVRSRLPQVPTRLAEQLVGLMQQIRQLEGVLKPPGVAETLDWVRALHCLGRTEVDLDSAAATIGAVCKYREDTARVTAALRGMLT
jgi:MoxR-like ATPase